MVSNIERLKKKSSIQNIESCEHHRSLADNPFVTCLKPFDY